MTKIGGNALIKKMYLLSGIFFFYFIVLIDPVSAHCPLCTAATGAAVATSRWLGFDDLVTGTFIGGLILSTSLWFNNILKKGNKGGEYIKFQSLILFAVTLASTTIGFYFLDIIGPENGFKLFGIDRILIGMTTGLVASITAFKLHEIARNVNSNKNYIPFQSIAILLLVLAFVSIGFYIVGWVV